MDKPDLMERFKLLPESLKMVVGMLALVGVPTRKTRFFQYLSAAGIKSGDGKSYTNATFGAVLKDLVGQGLIQEGDDGFQCVPAVQTPILLEFKEQHGLPEMCNAVEQVDRVGESYGYLYVSSFNEGVLHLRMALLRQDDPSKVQRWLKKCMEMRGQRPHPYIQMFDQPFDVRLVGLLRPEVCQDVLGVLLLDTFDHPSATTPELLQMAHQSIGASPQAPRKMVSALVENYLLRAQLDQITELVRSGSDDIAQAATSAVLLLRGDQEAALAGFEAALKSLRKETSKRTAIFDELQGILYVLALLRSKDAALRKKAKVYTEVAQRQISSGHYSFVYLDFLCLVHDGLQQAEGFRVLPKPNTSLATLVYHLGKHWLALPRTSDESGQLAESLVQAERMGWFLVAAQASDLLGRTKKDSSIRHAERAAAWFKQFKLVPMADWFERQEPWQRQLAALAGLGASGGGAVATAAQTRMVWQLTMGGGFSVHVTPREQKRKGNGAWTSGRAVAIKRLYEEIASFDFLNEQDKRACAAIRKVQGSGYYSYAEYELRHAQALFALIGHPAVSWEDNPTIRVEVVRGEPELLIKKTGKDMLTLSLQPDLAHVVDGFVVFKETPTKVRVVQITDEHRRIGAILGKSLTLPARAKEMLLDAIAAISTLITVQSDVDVLPSNVESVEADARLHVHLLPHGEGLKLHLLVRPFTHDGPYYPPGVGTENVIAEIDGKPLQARRNLADETQARQELMARCPVLAQAPIHHGETAIDDPADCLELLLQLQQQTDSLSLVLAWPEGEKFRVSRELGAKNFSMSIKRNMDWFAAEGELTIDNDQVVSLMQLLELSAQARGRFIPLGDNQFLALTDDFRRRLDDLRAFSHTASGGVRVHALASGALEELAEVAAKTKADKHWKEHLQRLRELDTLQPVLPETLQADLRDYQLTGFQWLCRLAHWGVGACLADDMGLGKTLQALALLLARAPGGPALVVAPTSVCMNWLSEVARFAPTLNVILFGAGDRGATLTDLQPFDLVVCSYGLLQNENERFAAVQWHTVVLDEAQAIKNFQTKRSQAAMALVSNFRLICSGTPLENHLGELWNLFRFTNPGLLGSLEHFNERYAGPIERLQDAQARNRLRRLIQPFILRRTKSEVLSELPARTEIVRQVELSAEEAALYEALRREALERLANADADGNAGQRHIQILAEIMKLRRACCNPQLVAPKLGLSSSKLAAFGELLDELLANRHKALVFSQFVDHLSLIREYLDTRGVRYQYLDGATPMQERKVRVDAFQAGVGDVFLISLKAGGTGLNLTAADYVIHMDPWWNPAVEDQASDRAHRIGQTRPVTIYRLVARQTIEEKIVDLHQHKRALADSLLEGSDLAGKMSADDMLALLQEEMRAQ